MAGFDPGASLQQQGQVASPQVQPSAQPQTQAPSVPQPTQQPDQQSQLGEFVIEDVQLQVDKHIADDLNRAAQLREARHQQNFARLQSIKDREIAQLQQQLAQQREQNFRAQLQGASAPEQAMMVAEYQRQQTEAERQSWQQERNQILAERQEAQQRINDIRELSRDSGMPIAELSQYETYSQARAAAIAYARGQAMPIPERQMIPAQGAAQPQQMRVPNHTDPWFGEAIALMQRGVPTQQAYERAALEWQSRNSR